MAKTNRGRPASRFDFGSNIDPNDAQTATLSDLLQEINIDFRSDNGTVFHQKNLETALRFLRSDSCLASLDCVVLEVWLTELQRFAENKPGRDVVVGPGDSLWRIATGAYGSGRHWVALAAANKIPPREGGILQLGQTLYVPQPSLLYDTEAPSVILRGSSLWREWKLVADTCPAGTVRISWEQLTKALKMGADRTYQGEKPAMCA